MFKSEGEMAIAMTQDRVFDIDGWIMKFDPKGDYNCGSPFVSKCPKSTEWEPIGSLWGEYKRAKEVFPELDKLKSCVVNYLLGKESIDDEEVDEILGMDSDCFWTEGSDEKQTRGFFPRHELSMGVDVDAFRIEKQGDVYLAVEQGRCLCLK